MNNESSVAAAGFRISGSGSDKPSGSPPREDTNVCGGVAASPEANIAATAVRTELNFEKIFAVGSTAG